MTRRELLTSGALIGGALAVGGIVWGRAAYARSQLTEKLVTEAIPDLTDNAYLELESLPAAANQQIRTWFHGPCLNSRRFAEEICSVAFTEQLAVLPSMTSKEHLFANAFVRHVVSASEICTQVGIVAEQIGKHLDSNWKSCCRRISQKWDVIISARPGGFAEDLEAELEPMIRQSIGIAITAAAATGQQEALSTAANGLGRSALTILPIMVVKPVVGIPLFLLLAIHDALPAMLGLTDGRVEEQQSAVSSELAILARRIGARFESETRARIVELHQWQDQALRAAAQLKAKQTVGILGVL